ncbi:MAG: hypothetical protein KC910_03815 [Candidatus Eremiobacteraeota bacterium]|nr:hypothetical protein [Candidatus Eremiobacteraeota bacterium]
MGDLENPKWLYAKGVLFLLLGLMAAVNLLLLHPEPMVAGMLALAIWAFARAYYFAFYVIEHYIDGDYRFAGLWDFLRYSTQRMRDRTLS